MLFVLAVTGVLAQDAAATEAVADTTAQAAPAASGGMLIGIWHLHSAVRWLVVLITVVLLVKLLVGLVGNQPFDGLANGLTRAFSIGIGVQWLIGIILFVVFGSFSVRYRWEHAVIMTVAVALAGMTARWKNAPDSQRYRMTLLIVVVVLVLVYVGVALLPQGWRAMPTV
jgi:hypothetical protein